MAYLADEIGDEYLNWDQHHVLISTPTGSGKTTFILKKLLPRAIAARKYIVYMCNRRFLRSQFEVLSKKAHLEYNSPDANDSVLDMQIPADQSEWILFNSYQYYEKLGHANDLHFPADFTGYTQAQLDFITGHNKHPQGKTISYDDVMYFIYDEAHYFLADSMFNSRCNFWFDNIGFPPINFPEQPKSTHIYLTATPHLFKIFLASHYLMEGFEQYHQNGTDLERIYNKLHTKYQEKHKLLHAAKTPTRVLQIDLNSHETEISFQYDSNLESYLEQAAQIKPCREVFSEIQSHIKKLPIIEWGSNVDNKYKNMPTTYFSDLFQLIPHIKKSLGTASLNQENHPSDSFPTKWLIFIDNEIKGIELAARLHECGIPAVLLSSRTLSNDQLAQREFQKICQTNKFAAPVIISTAVMDCGVSIHDPAVKYISVSHPNKFTFLQMLGRKRLAPEEKVNLYIQSISPKSIRSKRYALEDAIQFLCKFALKDKEKVTKLNSAPRKLFRDETRIDLMDDAIRQHNSLLYFHPHYHKSQSSSDQYWLDYEPGKSALIYAICQVADYANILEQAEQEADNEMKSEHPDVYERCRKKCMETEHRIMHFPIDRNFYLKYQLSWIGQKYEKRNWINYQETSEDLSSFLNAHLNEEIRKENDEQREFSSSCMEILKEYPNPGKCLQRVLSAYNNKNALPQMTALNNIFSEIDMPYKIKSKQMCKNGERYSAWFIISTTNQE